MQCCRSGNPQTDDIIKQVEEIVEMPVQVIQLVSTGEDDGQLEKAMRTWAASDARAAAAIAWIDQRRLDYRTYSFKLVSGIDAKPRARLAYYSWVGEFTVGIPSSQAERLAEIKLNHAILVRRD